MSLALYGGSFNPPHLGHREAASAILRLLRPEKLLIMPDHLPPHKELPAGSPTAEERFALCELAFEGLPGAVVSDRELSRGGLSYTVDTVRRLLEEHPGQELFLVLGGDMLLSFEQWYCFRELLKVCTLAVVSRDGAQQPALEAQIARLRECYGARILLVPCGITPCSSTELRALLPLRQGRELLHPAVYGRIIARRFYGARPELGWLRAQSLALLKEKRRDHVLGCEQEAVRLAQRWGVDAELAAEAAILHDATKKYKLEEQLNLCEKYGIILHQAKRDNPAVLHAITGAAFAKERFGATEEVCDAIRWHTTGRAGMSELEKIIWLADYIEPTRGFPGVEQARSLAYEDLNAAMAYGLDQTLQHLYAHAQQPHPATAAAAEWFHTILQKET